MDIKIHTWQISDKACKRLSIGHGWVYSNELLASPKGILPGSLVKVVDRRNNFIAWTYANPNSLVCARILSRQEVFEAKNINSWLFDRLKEATLRRQRLGRLNSSHRLVFSESDQLPGLIVDCYLCTDLKVFSVEINTAGMETLFFPHAIALLKELSAWQFQNKLSEFDATETAIIIHRSSPFRVLEGLKQLPVMVSNTQQRSIFENIKVLVPTYDQKTISLELDLINGQKTGLFLDQIDNIHMFCFKLAQRHQSLPRAIKILDVCCYVGQWSAQLAYFLKNHNIHCQTTVVDDSTTALQFAEKNLNPFTAHINIVKCDVLKNLPDFRDDEFDLVIIDPPAFIKSKKHLPQGQKAYEKLNKMLMPKVKPHGYLISCSCSHLFDPLAFQTMLKHASFKSETSWQSLGFWGQSEDHPVYFELPESQYLKCFVGMRNLE